MHRYKFSDIVKEHATLWEYNPIGTDYVDFRTLYKGLRQLTAVEQPTSRFMKMTDGTRTGKRNDVKLLALSTHSIPHRMARFACRSIGYGSYC